MIQQKTRSVLNGLPVWARRDEFPVSGEGWGWVDRKGGIHSCESMAALKEVISKDGRGDVRLVWTPEHGNCVVPEEVDELEVTISEGRRKWAVEDLADALYRVKVLGAGISVLLAYMLYQGWVAIGFFLRANGVDVSFLDKLRMILRALMESTVVGTAMFVFLVFGFIPWYQAWKKKRDLGRFELDVKEVVPMLRFETWLERQRAPVTLGMMILLGVVFLVQVWKDGSFLMIGESLTKAGLVKPLEWPGDYWRVLSAPMLHGGVLHIAMNGMALLYLGKRMEIFAGWPHVPGVFLFSAMVGGEASARFLSTPSVGASGGLMGLLGFLLVFETLHSRLVPLSSRRRLLGGLVLTALIGLVGYRFIDNAAHLGGLLAGMVYAGIVFPKSASVERPKMNLMDRVFGWVSLLAVVGSGVLAIWKVYF